MTVIRDIMTADPTCVRASETVHDAALKGKDSRAVHAGELAQGTPVLVDANDDVDSALQKMSDHKVRRLPVLDGDQLVGIVAQADVARALADPKVGDLVQALSVD